MAANSPSEDLKDKLVAQGVGTFAASSGWSISIGHEYADPHTTITLYDTSGGEPNPKHLLDEPNVQVRVRADPGDQPGAYAKAREVMNTLLGLPQETINGTVYVGIWALNDPYLLGYDDNQRPLYTVNFRLVREPSSGDHRTSL